MGQRIIRGLAIGALAGFSLAPIGAAGASGAAGATNARQQAWDQAVQSAASRRGQNASASASPSSTPSVAAASAAVTVTPDTDLVRGQTVSVAGTDLGTSDIVVLECGAGVTPAYNCDLGTFLSATPDATGALTVDFTVHRVIDSPSGRIDCATTHGACDLVVADFSALVLARHALGFDPNAVTPQPQVIVTPATNLLAGQVVTVAGTGFAPNDGVRVSECATTDPFCNGSGAYVTAAPDGSLSTQLTVQLRVSDGNGTTTHCLAVDCIVRAASTAYQEDFADAPISFDPNQPLPPVPAITVTPSTDLLHDQSVTISGTGFDPNGFVDLSECTTETDPFCGDSLAGTQVDAAGAFSTTATVSRLASAFTGTGSSIVDCAIGPCFINALGFSTDEFLELTAHAPISFDGSVPPPALPAATVTPATDLPYRTQVAVHGTGFAPGESVYADFCATSTQDGGCTSYAQGTADSAGTVDLTLNVKRRLYFGNVTAVDCTDPGTQCFVAVQGQRNYERTQTNVTFDPNAAIPPPPVATVTPDHDLGFRQAVAITGSGFPPGPIVIEQCAPADRPGPNEACTGFTQVTADGNGAITASVQVRRLLDFGAETPIDCATGPSPCTLQIGSGDPDVSAVVPLGFDPNSQPPPPPVVVVSPSTHIRDGQEVIVGGVGFAANALVGMAPCKVGVTAIADSCDIGRAGVATTNSNGGFLTSATAAGVIQTSQGPVDCTATADACVLAVANAADLSEFAVASMSFDAPELMAHSVTVTEGTGGTTPAEVMVELSQPTLVPITAEWQATPGTATTDDFMQTRGRVTIPAGAGEAMIHVDIVGDAVDEPTERFTVNVTDAPGTHIAGGTATVKIHDDDRQPRIRLGDFSTTEGDAGTSLGYVPVWLDGPSGRDIVVEYRTHHGSARSGSDFVRSRGEITIPAGWTGGFITVPIVGDRDHERTESFTVEVRDASYATIGDDTATETIYDND